ncbi:MAG: MarR family winged helix-turn-helix transcriptional regulator [Chthoniobacter sp.]
MLKNDRKDARARQVRLTPKGRAKLAECRALWRVVQARFEARFGAEPSALLSSTLVTLATTDFSPAHQNQAMP